MHSLARTRISPRPQIGVLLTEMEGDYHRALLDGVCRKADALGVDLVFYPGHLPGTPVPFEQQFGVVFEMVDPRLLDGLLIFGSTLQFHLDDAGMRCFLDRFGPLNAVVIGHELPGRPAVVLDNHAGFKQLVQHFIVTHGHRRIAMIESPGDNHDAQERLQAYLDAHRDAGLDVDPALRVQGQFHQVSGRQAMQDLLARGAPFGALVCANDEMAQGALSVAVERGLRVPEDLAIGGFDDLLSIYHVGPSLTTVNQAIDTQGETALALLVRRFRGEAVAPQTRIATRLVLRRSCGCIGQMGALALPQTSLQARAEELVRQMDAPAHLTAGLVDDVLALREALLDDVGAKSFEEILTRVAFAWLQRQADISRLQNLLLGLQQHLVGPLPSPQLAHQVAQRLQRGQIALVNSLELFHNRERVLMGNSAWDLRRQLKTRVTTDDVDALLAVLADALKKLGIGTCFIALYRAPLTLAQVRSHGLPSTSRLVLALEHGELHTEWMGQDFPTTELMPASVHDGDGPLRRVVLPMFYLQEHFGFIVLDRQREERFNYEDLRHEITTALHSCLVVKELGAARDLLRSDLDRAQRDNEALSHLAMRDDLTGLFNRRGFFELAQTLMSTARLTGQPLTLIFADLDGLKLINDNHGHEEGDAAIRASARLLQQTFRQDDIVSRIGGDEFVVLTRSGSLDSLPEIERRLDKRFDEFNAASGKPYRVGCGLGGRLIQADSIEPLDSVLAQADRLLYDAKRRKRALRETSAPPA